MARAALTIDAARNQVVQRHPNMCHHCGCFAVPVTHRCEGCGVQSHAGCGRPGLCDVCRAGGPAHVPRCHLCNRPDLPAEHPTATDRLGLRLVYHGFRWRRSRSARVPAGTLELPPDSHVARELARDPARTFERDELPGDGGRRMKVAVEGRGVFSSVPMVAHTWCAACLFQVAPDEPDAQWRQALLARMRASSASPNHGTRRVPVTRGGAACQFCGKSDGWLTFCAYHLTHGAGCQRCRDPSARARSFHAFHPSCAVRHGMQRIVKRGRSGMACAHSARRSDWRARQLRPLSPWLGALSGVNHDLLELTCLFPSNVLHGTDVPRKGGRRGYLLS